MKRRGDKEAVRETLVRLTVAAHPGTLEREDLESEPAIARADKRTVHAEIRRLARASVLSVIHTDPVNGTVLRMQATDPAAEAVAALRGTP